MSEEPISCEKFCFIILTSIYAFQSYWTYMSQSDKVNFPDKMNEADWLEQFDIFMAMKNESGDK